VTIRFPGQARRPAGLGYSRQDAPSAIGATHQVARRIDAEIIFRGRWQRYGREAKAPVSNTSSGGSLPRRPDSAAHKDRPGCRLSKRTRWANAEASASNHSSRSAAEADRVPNDGRYCGKTDDILYDAVLSQQTPCEITTLTESLRAHDFQTSGKGPPTRAHLPLIVKKLVKLPAGVGIIGIGFPMATILPPQSISSSAFTQLMRASARCKFRSSRCPLSEI